MTIKPSASALTSSRNSRRPGLSSEIHPELGGPYTEDIRCVFLRRFPFGVLYSVERQEVVVHAVAHQRRRPGSGAARHADVRRLRSNRETVAEARQVRVVRFDAA